MIKKEIKGTLISRNPQQVLCGSMMIPPFATIKGVYKSKLGKKLPEKVVFKEDK